jgi:hypothetical protein
VPLNGHDASAEVKLSCGIIVFPHTGPPLTRSITTPVLEAEPVASVAG